MTRLELITVLVARARSNGFEFRRWYTAKLGLPWISAEAALSLLDQQRRYYALIFSHEFALAFWKAGTYDTFTMPEKTFTYAKSDGSIGTTKHKAFQRRSARRATWQHHLREMAATEEPLRYLRRYIHLDEEPHLDDAPPAPPQKPAPVRRPGPVPKPMANPMPTDIPHFMRRPYP